MDISRRWWVLLVAVLLLQGCGLKFWYNRLDWVVPWYVDDYVELTDGQEERLEQLMRLKTEWHRSEELPKYVAWLDQLKQDIEQGDIESIYDGHYRRMIDFYWTLLEQLTSDFAEMMVGLSDEQVSQLIKALEERDQKSLKRHQKRDDEDRLELREDDIKDGLGEWVGRLSKSQKQLADQWAKELQPTLELRLEYRKIWRERLTDVLHYRQQPDSVEQLKDLFVNASDLQSNDLKQRYRHNREVTRRYLIKFYDTMSAKQKRRLLARIEDYREDFQDLMDDAAN